MNHAMDDDQDDEVMELPFAMTTADDISLLAKEKHPNEPWSSRFSAAAAAAAAAEMTSSSSSNVPTVPDLMASTMSASEGSNHIQPTADHDDDAMLDAAASLWLPDSSLARQMESSSIPNLAPLVTPAPSERIPLSRHSEHESNQHDYSSSDPRCDSIPQRQQDEACSLILSAASIHHGRSSVANISPAIAASGVSVHRLSDDSFTAEVTMGNDPLPFISSAQSWRHWCTAIVHPVIVLSESCSQNNQQDRQYEGIWTDATVGRLKSPNPWDCIDLPGIFGCPSTFGRLSLFVQHTVVTATLGPFAGNSEQRFKFTIIALPDGRVRVHVTVRIVHDVSWSLTRPTILQHRDQVITSMARLRFLVEDGSTADPATHSLGTPLLQHHT